MFPQQMRSFCGTTSWPEMPGSPIKELTIQVFQRPSRRVENKRRVLCLQDRHHNTCGVYALSPIKARSFTWVINEESSYCLKLNRKDTIMYLPYDDPHSRFFKLDVALATVLMEESDPDSPDYREMKSRIKEIESYMVESEVDPARFKEIQDLIQVSESCIK